MHQFSEKINQNETTMLPEPNHIKVCYFKSTLVLLLLYLLFILSIFADLLKDNNKEIDQYEGMLFHIQSFVIILKVF